MYLKDVQEIKKIMEKTIEEQKKIYINSSCGNHIIIEKKENMYVIDNLATYETFDEMFMMFSIRYLRSKDVEISYGKQIVYSGFNKV